jgi:putative DNA primase/helicase
MSSENRVTQMTKEASDEPGIRLHHDEFDGDPGGPSPEVLALVGARFVSASEFSSDQKLSVTTIKQWTGEGTMTARGLHKDPVKFAPVGKVWMMSNHFPKTGGDEGVNRRIHVIPCLAKFSDDPIELAGGAKPRDRGMPAKLREEATGILAWAVEGARLWYAQGLQPPRSVKDAVESYKSETDPIYDFWSSCIIFDNRETTTTPKKAVYDAYRMFAWLNGDKPETKNKITRLLKQKGATDAVNTAGTKRVWERIRLTEDGEELRAEWENRPRDQKADQYGDPGPQRRLTGD